MNKIEQLKQALEDLDDVFDIIDIATGTSDLSGSIDQLREVVPLLVEYFETSSRGCDIEEWPAETKRLDEIEEQLLGGSG